MQSAAVLEGSPWLTTRIARSSLLSTVSLFLFLCAWHWRVTGALTLPACAVLGLLLGLYLAYGQLFAVLAGGGFRNTLGLPFQLLCGFFLCNSLLFVLALCSPFGMAVNLGLLVLLAAAGAFAVRKRRLATMPGAARSDTLAAWMAIAIAGLGATAWCGDVQAPLQAQDGLAVFKVWSDVYIHAREISVFAQAHGLATINDIKLAGGPAPLYHFASYLSAAAVNALGGTSAMQAYASFQLPFGILLTSLAAYCLAGSVFGRWAGTAAAAAVVLLPDAFLQGFQNRYLSYYFLTQVNLGMLYGIACVALAWLFVLDGVRRGVLRIVLLGYGFLALCLFYKAHIFVANSYLLMMFPILFFPALRPRWRAAIGIAATFFFVAVVAYSQTNPRVPVLRLDGSGISWYLVQLLHDYDSGVLKTFFTQVLLREAHAKPVQLVAALAMISISTFGAWLLVLPLAIAGAWKKTALPVLCFPLLVMLNYLVMTVGLAIDTRGVGTPDELLNRPLVWAYFVVAAWSAGLLVHTWGRGMPARRPLAAAMLCALAVALWGAWRMAPDLQTFPTRKGNESFLAANAVPACLVDAAAFIRTHAAPGDIVVDAANDPRFMLTALSERQLYVGAVGFGGANREQEARLAAVRRFMQAPDAAQLARFTATHGIAWFLAQPGTALAWPGEIARRHAFACGGYRLYRFPDAIHAAFNK